MSHQLWHTRKYTVSSSADTAHGQGQRMCPENVPRRPPPHMDTSRTTPTKLAQLSPPAHTLLSEGSTTADPRGAAKWLPVQEGRCVYLLPRGFPEPGDRDKDLSPSLQSHSLVRMCAYSLGNILYRVRPQPAPFQNKGRGWRTHK